jgi:hypothetical protein
MRKSAPPTTLFWLAVAGVCLLLVGFPPALEAQQSPKKAPPKTFSVPETKAPEPVLVAPPSLPDENPPNVSAMPSDPLSGSVGPNELALLGRGSPAGRRLDVGTIIRALLGFAAFFTLAYLAGHPMVTEWERRLKIGQLLTSGLPFVALGFLAAQPPAGILNADILREIAPLLPLGLGWIGFVVGSRFDSRRFESISPDSEASVFLTTAVPILVILGACGLMVYPFGLLEASTPGLLRDGLLLAIAGAMSARTAPMFAELLGLGSETPPARLYRIIELEQLAGVVGLFLICAFYRPPEALVGWQIPAMAWLYMTLGIGVAVGLVIWAILTRMNSPSYFPALLLGAVAFTAGMASFLRLSSLSVCFIAGALIINLGGSWKGSFQLALERLERPVYFLFLVIAGALWEPWDGRGWVLMLLFVSARAVANWVSAWMVRKYWVRDLTEGERRVLAHSPMGALSVAIVVSAYDLYSGPTVPLIITAIIGGSVLSELALQVSIRRGPRETAAQEAM